MKILKTLIFCAFISQCKGRADLTQVKDTASTCNYPADPSWYGDVYRILAPRTPVPVGLTMRVLQKQCPDKVVDTLMSKETFRNFAEDFGVYFTSVEMSVPDSPSQRIADAIYSEQGNLRDAMKWRDQKGKVFLGDWFASTYPNTSTNFNRKRAAYIFRNILCDDLSPTSVAPAEGPKGEDSHLSDPACMACHYKLDPLAGLFKNMGVRDGSLRFLNDVTIQGEALTTYLNRWPDGTTGFIRSPTNRALNAYANGIDHAFDTIFAGNTPEVTRCFVKRASDMVLKSDQKIDTNWIDREAAEFTTSWSTQKNANAFRKFVRALVLSETFRKGVNRNKNTCYDKVPSPTGEEVPCEIRFTINTYCASCHSPNNSVNLLEWERQGQGWVPQQTSLEAIRQSLLTVTKKQEPGKPKAVLRMPLDKEMPDPERALLVGWVEEQQRAVKR